MKRTFFDKFLGFFSPDLELKRINSKIKSEMLVRGYDAAKTFSTDDWTSATKGSPNTEIRGAQETLRMKGSDLVRNNSYGNRGLQSIVSNTVGAGIMANIKGKTKLQTKRVNEAWKEWSNSALCDSNGQNNFYGLQSLVMRSMVERGEIIVIKEVFPSGMKLRLLESDYIASHIDSGSVFGKKINSTVQGVKVDENGKIISFFIYKAHPGEVRSSTEILEIPSEKVCHVFRQDRPGQLRGVTWFAPVIRLLNDLHEYQQATLIGRKISACFAAFITTNDSDATMSASDLKTKRETENMLNPGSIRYLQQGENISIATPPKVDGYSEYVNQMLRSIASGLGISYESLTSDYSQVNYSSGRMGHIEFRKNVEHWQFNILIPSFCDPAFKHFLDWCQIVKGINVEGVTVEWIPPAPSMLDPGKEIAAMKDGIRAGLISYQKAVRLLGYEPDEMLEEIETHNQNLDDKKIVLDSDPRNTTQAGLFQVVIPQSNSKANNNEKDNETSNTISNAGN